MFAGNRGKERQRLSACKETCGGAAVYVVGGGSSSVVCKTKGWFMVKCVMRAPRPSPWARILLGRGDRDGGMEPRARIVRFSSIRERSG